MERPSEHSDNEHNAPATERDTDHVSPDPKGEDARKHDMTDPRDRSREQIEGAGNPEPSDGGAPDDPASAQTNRSPVQAVPHTQPRPGMAVKYTEQVNREGRQSRGTDAPRVIAATIASINENDPTDFTVDLNLWRTNDDPLFHVPGADKVPAVPYGTGPGTWSESA
jgi:hypothetical protein